MRRTERSEQARRYLDRRLAALKPVGKFAAPQSGWIHAIRNALGMSAAVLGRRTGVSAPAVLALENSEREGRIRLDTLRRAAEALDCVVVYALIPKTTLQDTVEQQALHIAAAQRSHTMSTMALEDQAVEFDEEFLQKQTREIIEEGRQWTLERE